MKRRRNFWKSFWIIPIVLPVLLGGCLAGCSSLGLGTSWKEEVLLHDGRVVIIERSVERGGRYVIGGKPPYKEQRLSFTMPDTNQKIIWEDHFSPELGMANFLPRLIDIHSNIPYLVVTPMGCLSYNKWGRPNPPYVVFQYVDNRWQRIPVSELPDEIKIPNMIASMPDTVVEQSGTRFMTKEMIQKIISNYRQVKGSQTILREPIEPCAKPGSPSCPSYGSQVDCEKMIWYGCGWGAPGESNRKYFERVCKDR